ncbi:MAG: glycosyltransferase family 39 protein [Burkholderiales bacterium]
MNTAGWRLALPLGRRIALPLAPALSALLVLAYLLPGLVGHDPWKSEDAIGVGIVYQMLHHGQWLVPHLAGEPFFEDGPFYYWIAALTARLLDWALAMHDGARLASGVLTAATLWFTFLAGREMYGRTEVTSAALALLGCLGLLVYAHETLAEIGMLAGQALAWYGIALAQRKPRHAGWPLGLGIVIAALSKGPAAAIAPLAIALIAPLISAGWRRRAYIFSLLAAAVTVLGFLGGWLALVEARSPAVAEAWWHAQIAVFTAPDVNAFVYWAETLAWAAWPAWPLAFWALWERRHRRFEPGTRMLIAAFAVSLAVLLAQRDPREVFALPLLLPLALLAGAGVPSLRRGAANALAWFGVMSAALFGALVWLGWIAMMTGVPPTIAHNFAKLEPGHVPQFSWGVFAIALALTLAWLWLLLRSERSALRSITFWAAGTALLWGLLMTLWIPWIDYGMSYRPVALALKKALPAGTRCIESRDLGETQRAAFDYHAGIVTERLERRGDARCALLLVQARQGDNDSVGPGWKLIWEGNRPRDRERYRLYERQT